MEVEQLPMYSGSIWGFSLLIYSMALLGFFLLASRSSVYMVGISALLAMFSTNLWVGCFFFNLLIDFRERGEERVSKLISCSSSLCIHWLILVCALTWDQAPQPSPPWPNWATGPGLECCFVQIRFEIWLEPNSDPYHLIPTHWGALSKLPNLTWVISFNVRLRLWWLSMRPRSRLAELFSLRICSCRT